MIHVLYDDDDNHDNKNYINNDMIYFKWWASDAGFKYMSAQWGIVI